MLAQRPKLRNTRANVPSWERLFPWAAVLVLAGMSAVYPSLNVTIVMLVVLATIGASEWRLLRDKHLIERGDCVSGIVIETLHGRRGGGLRVRFVVNNRVYERVARLPANAVRQFSTGDTVTLFVDPDRPTSFAMLESGRCEIVP